MNQYKIILVDGLKPGSPYLKTQPGEVFTTAIGRNRREAARNFFGYCMAWKYIGRIRVAKA